MPSPLAEAPEEAFISWFATGVSEYTGAVKLAWPSVARWMFFLAIAAGFIVLPVPVWGSPAASFPRDFTLRAWNKLQGLPDDSVTSVLQTRDGYLWVGTPSGLARFDGIRFVVMSPQNWGSNAPPSVTALCEDSKGIMWIGTQDNGLLCYEDGVVNPFPSREGFHFQTVNSIAEDTTGALWVGTPGGLVRLAGDRLNVFTKKDGLPNDFISNVHVARSGTIWITTRGGMCRFKDGRIEAVPFQIEGPGRNPESLGVYEDRRGQLWAYGDTYLVNLTDGKHLNHFGSGDAISTRIWSLCEGKNGELWIGTSGKGLYCFVEGKFQTVTLHGAELSSDVRAICQDRQGNLWLGTHSDGLVRLQPRSVRLLDASSGLPGRSAVCLGFNSGERCWVGFDHAGLYAGAKGELGPVASVQNLVSSIWVTPDSSVWVGTAGAGLYCLAEERCVHLTTADGLSDNDVTAVAADSDQSIWVGTAAGLHRITGSEIASFGTAEGLPDGAITAILPSRAGGVWLGFNDGAVFRENHGQFRCVFKPPAASGKAVRALCEDTAGRIWIGSEDSRVGCLLNDRFLNCDLLSGAADSSVAGLIMTDDGDLWIETDRSVYCVAQKALSGWLSGEAISRPQLIFRTDSTSENRPGYGWPRAMKSPDGSLWFAMDSGVVTVDLTGTLVDVSPPPVLIEDIAVNKEPLPRAQSTSGGGRSANAPVRLPSNLSSLDINFTALDLSAPEKIRFRHRLDGFDLDWVADNDSTRNANYGRLPYGTYTFRVQAGGADQRWFDNEASFHFIIPTPLWRTSWALATYSLAALALAGGIARVISARRYRRRLAALAAQQAMERERMRIARDMHDEIGSKLTKISFMSERAKHDLQAGGSVAGKLDSIAGTSRELLQTLDEIVWAVNPHNDTLEHLAAYLGQYATEYLQNTAVECELHIPRGLPHHPLSAEARHNLFLAFEESLNNALKHGRPKRVRVDMQVAPEQFEIRIEDDGRGFDVAGVGTSPKNSEAAAAGNRDGLQNMRQRLEVLGGKCRVESHAGRGTVVTLSVPLLAKGSLKSNGRNGVRP